MSDTKRRHTALCNAVTAGHAGYPEDGYSCDGSCLRIQRAASREAAKHAKCGEPDADGIASFCDKACWTRAGRPRLMTAAERRDYGLAGSGKERG